MLVLEKGNERLQNEIKNFQIIIKMILENSTKHTAY